MAASEIATPPAPDKIVQYPVTGDETGGRLFLFGKADSPTIVLFCAGYPDDHGSFSPMAKRLADEANCLCGVACLVGYDDNKRWTLYRSQGYTFDEMTTSLRAAAKALRQASTYPNATLTTIFHDWGSGIGASYTNQALEENDALVAPAQIVYFDVLPTKLHPSCPQQLKPATKTLYEKVTETAYRIVFAKAFLIQRFVSSTLAAIYFIISFVILGALRLAPSHPLDSAIFESRKVELSRLIYMAYPYYHMFRHVLSHGLDKSFSTFHLANLKETPVLYLYGADKAIQFHDKNVVAYLQQEADGKSNAIGVSDAAHWLYLQQPDVCFEAVKKFILDEKK